MWTSGTLTRSFCLPLKKLFEMSEELAQHFSRFRGRRLLQPSTAFSEYTSVSQIIASARMPNSKFSKFRMSDFSAVLIASCLAMLAVGENSTAIMAALPAMTGSLQLSSLEVEWVVNAYLLTAARLHHFGRRRGGPLRCPILLDCRNWAICFCVTGDSDCPRWMGRYRRACITRPWGGIRRSRHTGGGDRGIARTTASGSDRYVDRLSDARFQHWTADRGRNHSLCGLAFYFLVERDCHDGRRAYYRSIPGAKVIRQSQQTGRDLAFSQALWCR